MSLKGLFNTYSNIGTKPDHKPWEASFIRKLNLLAFFGTLNVIFALTVFLSFDYTYFFWDCVLVLIFAPLVLVLNTFGKYVWSAYLFSFIGYGMFGSLNLKMGDNSHAFILYFPLTMSIVQLLARREMMKHMIAVLAIGFLSASLVMYGLREHWMQVQFEPEVLNNIRTINLFFGLFTTLLFVTTMSYEGMRQEKLIHNVLREKEVLLAEVFHRVKNNMNIVTSLLNLKKNASSSLEVQEALEECRNRVFSMALVHQKIYSTRNFTKLNFKEYVSDLVSALRASVGSNQAIIDLECEAIDLELSNAIPCGLILNELITNSFKHATTPKGNLRVSIWIKQLNKEVMLSYRDNGPGLPEQESMNADTLGLVLVKSLAEQLDAKFEFGNEKGFTFDLKFAVK
ncbi:MAG: sensor histidine kinase [Bacteroidia bacterium]|nr:sensor histidine kinase [Bacteroidia bacterium]